MRLVFPDRTLDSGDRPLVMGILNVTPDSFSDGGAYHDAPAALPRAREMIAEGADFIDVGPESTRPGAQPVPADEQIARAVPVIEALRAADARVGISIDTRLAAVASAALDAGADLVNDVSALRDDPALVHLVAKRRVPVVLMHMRGTPADMQRDGGPQYDDVVADVCRFLRERVDFAVEQGIEPDRIILDPGLGFGKRVEHNLSLLRHLDRLMELGYPLLLGASRKRFLGYVLGSAEPRERLAGSLACAVLAALAGVAILRVHDVRPTVEVLRVLAAVGRTD
ncbi:MAG TPA: dihydropteroate synthase [Phycisphaerae bacterium]|nr:dihydropteroate synthase [Phycisphaerae bacterium]HNU45739.1 dihydropteroate synthase [Phycisphaerae bacterium]